ncbi:polyketide synthase dehydratase domain-containing protein, partial [Streptomyces sp. NRRL F-5126]|uniref:polyketide synthase dehydratase domain-containing protein n=1 Tax=Streptomyces sp. NRRL F-5126 TaxID=1463857 RepID=UPI00131A6382
MSKPPSPHPTTDDAPSPSALAPTQRARTTSPPGLAEHGYTYGPTFQGLTAAWHDNHHTYADITLPETDTLTADAETGAFDIHPALLDAALHTIALQALDTPSGDVSVPFSWTGVDLYSTGARHLRVKLTP